ncbi:MULTISPECIES: hypothetical protein [Cyanophyceae]|uniref:hypothetical protein n=1 Tax=Cyanophyceae TaxID=3028117 RepID=UPI0016845056|nr:MULTISPECIES: hypothetical protein [Cyanophyceae]MBD1916394.1 hypothetical protein [Phormidium sp. FACHB-77]MBD2032686.1 hypothetical protein [Phormidium sp. FACHB-322]MBD2050058.1 hypothetical protein [Leptolyngbya sp. FACHB-60]
MMPDNNDPTKDTQLSPLRWASRFAGGAALGAVLVALPLSYGSPLSLDSMQIARVGFVVLGCGVMAMIWGQALIDAVMESLGKTGL